MNISIVIPVYNEGHAIGKMVELIKAQNHDVIVVDDGSTDGCGEDAKQNGAHVIRHDGRNGKGYSLQTGFRYAVEQGYDAVIAMDGDGQHRVEDIDAFIQEAEKHPDCVINGNRMVNAKDMPWVRRLTNQFMSFLISMPCRQKIPDTQCGFRYIGSKVLKDIQLKCTGFEIETEILMKASKKGYKIFSVPVQTVYAGEESHINPLRDTWRFLVYFVKELFSRP